MAELFGVPGSPVVVGLGGWSIIGRVSASVPGRIGRFRVVRLLGSGGFAMVWLAHDERLQVDVSIKVLGENLALQEEVRARFEREARLLRQCESNRVVEVFDIDELPDG